MYGNDCKDCVTLRHHILLTHGARVVPGGRLLVRRHGWVSIVCILVGCAGHWRSHGTCGHRGYYNKNTMFHNDLTSLTVKRISYLTEFVPTIAKLGVPMDCLKS